jgi:chemotaxis protein methyltransferase CheR/type IV pilus assembly protein PilK
MTAWSPKALPDIDDDEFALWVELLELRTGISFEKYRPILQAGLKQRMQEISCDSFSEYFQWVTEGKQAAAEWTALLRTLTVKETRFFRDPDALDFVRKYLHKLLSEKKHQSSVELWSVACSTGEEPYSLAMITNEVLLASGSTEYFGVTASDICLSSLAQAKKGVYANRRLETVPKTLVSRYFDAINEQQSVIKAAIKQRICFVQANIIELEDLPVNNMDVIYCQNVLIYFKRWRQQAVLDNLVDRLKINGILVIGMGEAAGWSNKKVARIKNERVQAYIKIA